MSTYPQTVDVAALRLEAKMAREAAALATSLYTQALAETVGLRGDLESCRSSAALAVAKLTEAHRTELASLTESHRQAHGSEAETIRQLRGDLERLSAERRVLAGDLVRSRAEADEHHQRSKRLSAALTRLRKAAGAAPIRFVPEYTADPPGDRFRDNLWPRVDSVSAMAQMERIDRADRALLEKARSELVRAVECIRRHESFVEEVSDL